LYKFLLQVNPSLLPVAASLVPVVKHLFTGIRRSDYPPVIDDEITELLAGTQRNTPPRTQRSRTPERKTPERMTPERKTPERKTPERRTPGVDFTNWAY
jgi:hypothetical protein